MPPLKPIRVLLAVLALCLGAGGQEPTQPIRIWGHGHPGQDYILTLLEAWQAGFQKEHPTVRFDNQLTGNASGLGGLYTDAADLALLDREASFIEVDAYQQGTGYDPFRVPVAMGSVATPHHAPALQLFASKSNPLTGVTLAQVDALFDADHRLGGTPIHVWGDLGVTGPIAGHPIHIYTYPIQSAEIQFFERAALKGSQKLACCFTFLPDTKKIIAATSRDPYGMALITMAAPSLKPLPVDGTLPTAETISAHTYPLARTVYLYAHRKPNTALPPDIAAFLNFVLSPEGQATVAQTGGYLPLAPEAAAKARETLQ